MSRSNKEVGESFTTLQNDTKQITSILARPGPPEKVYNLEVNGEHTYFVGQQQLLVHNSCPPGGKIIGLGKGEHLHELGDGVLIARNGGWTRAGLTAADSDHITKFADAFLDSTRNADGILFNLRGVSVSDLSLVRRSGTLGARRINRITEWELRQVFNSPQLMDKTTFVLGDLRFSGQNPGAVFDLLRSLY